MQWKIARPGRFASWYHHWAMHHGFPILAYIGPRLPRWFLHLGARVVIWSVMFVHPAPKREIASNLARVLGEPVGSRRVRRATTEMIHNFAYYWIDLFRFTQLPYAASRRLLERVTGAEHVERALASGRGVLLLTAHLGNWELGGYFLRELDAPMSVVYVRDQFADAESFRSFFRRNMDVDQIAIDPGGTLSSLPVLRALRDGRVVAMQGDRDFNEKGVSLDFFGAPAPFPPGPFLFARMTGVPLIPTFIVYTADYGFEIEFGEPIEVERGGERQRDVRQALERWVATLERAVARWPTQWYTFYDFWRPGGEAQAPAAPAAVPREAAG
jgi:Kdo2-lipid IVA lauroyltransferase/acyltransferase